MRNLHWVAVGGFLTSLSVLVTTLPTWAAAETPAFIGSVIALTGSFVVALLSGGPVAGTPTAAVSESMHLTSKP